MKLLIALGLLVLNTTSLKINQDKEHLLQGSTHDETTYSTGSYGSNGGYQNSRKNPRSWLRQKISPFSQDDSSSSSSSNNWNRNDQRQQGNQQQYQRPTSGGGQGSYGYNATPFSYPTSTYPQQGQQGRSGDWRSSNPSGGARYNQGQQGRSGQQRRSQYGSGGASSNQGQYNTTPSQQGSYGTSSRNSQQFADLVTCCSLQGFTSSPEETYQNGRLVTKCVGFNRNNQRVSKDASELRCN